MIRRGARGEGAGQGWAWRPGLHLPGSCAEPAREPWLRRGRASRPPWRRQQPNAPSANARALGALPLRERAGGKTRPVAQPRGGGVARPRAPRRLGHRGPRGPRRALPRQPPPGCPRCSAAADARDVTRRSGGRGAGRAPP